MSDLPSGMRYKVVEGSQSCHCCFDFTVVDLYNPVMIGDKQYKYQFEALCECFDLESASKICEALNAVERLSKD